MRFWLTRSTPGSGQSDHTTVYPPTVPPEFQDNAVDPIVSIYDTIAEGMASDASQVWGLAHPRGGLAIRWVHA